MANFLGFKQVTLSSYNKLSVDEKKNYMWLVRDIDPVTSACTSSAIYFGSRMYAEVNATDSGLTTTVSNIITSLGASVDKNGNFVGFMPFEDHEILGDSGITSVTEALEALETAIVANEKNIATAQATADSARTEAADAQATADKAVADAATAQATADSARTEAADAQATADKAVADAATAQATADSATTKAEAAQTTADKAVADAATAQATADSARTEAAEAQATADQAQAEVDTLETTVSALTTEVGKKADADKVYTKSEIDEKISGVWHFKGTKEKYEDLPTTGNTPGDVWQVGDKEYAWNGTEWVELGFTVDLSKYATKDYVESARTELEAEIAEKANNTDLQTVAAAVSALTPVVDENTEDIEDLQKTAAVTATTYSEAKTIAKADGIGQIIYVTTDEQDPENSGITYTAGAYLVTGEGTITKLAQSSPTGDISGDVERLKAEVKELQDDKHTDITGDDVEE